MCTAVDEYCTESDSGITVKSFQAKKRKEKKETVFFN